MNEEQTTAKYLDMASGWKMGDTYMLNEEQLAAMLNAAFTAGKLYQVTRDLRLSREAATT